MKPFDFDTYISPFTWRYATPEMKYVFSEKHKYELWRRIWVALAQTQHEAQLVSLKELKDLEKHQHTIDIQRILEIESETNHDVVAAIREYAEKAKIGGGKIHLGATSMDIVDNADTLKLIEGLQIIETKLKKILLLFIGKIAKYEDLPCIGYTHLQPAEPTTVGYRFALYAQDVLLDFQQLQYVKQSIKSKGMKGAVGTGASYTTLLKGKKIDAIEFEKKVLQKLGLTPVIISNQVSPRKYDYYVLSLLASIGQSLAKFAADLRILQSPSIGECSEPFGKKQVGSSAMPFKRNPLKSEKICSLARYLNQLPPIALENGALSYLERTLDDSANKRVIIPESFLALDEILSTAITIISGMSIYEKKIAQNLALYAPFSATESILMESVKNGANRQEMHEVLRDISMQAWKEIQEGKNNSMEFLLIKNKIIQKFLTKKQILHLLDVSGHIGNVKKRSQFMIHEVKKIIHEK